MAITQHRPSEAFQSLLDDLFGGRWGGRLAGSDLLRAPEADVQENAEAIRVTLEVPGMRSDDVEVILEDNVLTVSGEKQEERAEEGGYRWHLPERRYGRFSRSFVLPRHEEHDRIEARLENGVLDLRIPKAEQARPRRIEVRNGGGRRRIMGGS